MQAIVLAAGLGRRLGKLTEIRTIHPAGLNQGPFKPTAVPTVKRSPEPGGGRHGAD